MIDYERVQHARDPRQRRLLRPFKQTDPHSAEQHERLDDLSGSPHFDDRQVSPVGEEADVQFQPCTATTANINFRSATTAIHQQKGQRRGSDHGSQEVHKPREVGTVLRSQCQM